MTDVTPRSAYRDLGNTDRESFAAQLSRTLGQPSPMVPEIDAIYNALESTGMTRLAAAMAWVERSNDTDPGGLQYYGREKHNAWAMKRGGGFATYASYEDAARDWVKRVLDRSGPYADADTLAEFIAIYAPASDGNDPAKYGATVAKLINERLPLLEEEQPSPPPSPPPAVDPWRPYPWPTFVRMICPKPVEGQGFDRVSPRASRIRGICKHITDGGGTIEGIHDLFSTGGERQYDALTDLTVGRDGRIGLLNDWKDNNWGGTRAGWANGGVDGLEGEGTAFYRKFPDINSALVSVENIAREGEKWTDAQISQSIELSTAQAQELKCPAGNYPYHPAYGGVSIEQQHRNFATKSCPANPFISTIDPVIRSEVKKKLAAWQGSAAPVDPTPTPDVPRYTGYGMTADQLSWFFGEMTRQNDDGSTEQLAFNPTGPLSLLWLARCEREGIFPEAASMASWDSNLAPGKEWVATWQGGWAAYLPLDNGRAGWRWIDPVGVVDKITQRTSVGV